MAVPMTYRNLTWRVHEASKRIRENHERQRAIIHAQNRSQLKIEREVIAESTTCLQGYDSNFWPRGWST